MKRRRNINAVIDPVNIKEALQIPKLDVLPGHVSL
jgi:hypothetical protein